jgi:serine/threonine protein kinase
MSRIVDNITQSNTMAGTWLYMSPEATKKSKNPQTDIWSVGVIFYEMLSGQFPFYEEDDLALIEAIRLKKPIPLPSQIPTELRVIVERSLQKDSAKRFQTAEEMRFAIDESLFVLKTRKAKLKETIIDSDWQGGHIKPDYPNNKRGTQANSIQNVEFKNNIKPKKNIAIENTKKIDFVNSASDLLWNFSKWCDKVENKNILTEIVFGLIPISVVAFNIFLTGVIVGDILSTALFLDSIFTIESILSFSAAASTIITIASAGIFSWVCIKFNDKFLANETMWGVLAFIFCITGFAIGLIIATLRWSNKAIHKTLV